MYKEMRIADTITRDSVYTTGSMTIDNSYTIGSVYTPSTTDGIWNGRDVSDRLESLIEDQRLMLDGRCVDKELQAKQKAGRKQIAGWRI